MPAIAFWIIVLIINGISYPGEEHYPTALACEEALDANATGLAKAGCMPIYEKESKSEPAFNCNGDLTCPMHYMGGI